MKIFKIVTFAIVLLTSLIASISSADGGGISGGPGESPAIHDLRICNFGESGDLCMTIRVECKPNPNGLPSNACNGKHLFKLPETLNMLNQLIQVHQTTEAPSINGP